MIRRLALLSWITLATAAVAQSDAPRPLDVGVNRAEAGTQRVSTDLFYAAELPDWAHLQSPLAAAHEAGSSVFVLANPKVVQDQPRRPGTITDRGIVLRGKAGPVAVAGWLVAGTNVFHVTGFTPADGDQDWPRGTPCDRQGYWANDAGAVLAPNLVVDGRDTGYPDGLAPGQAASWWPAAGGTAIRLPAGDWTPRAAGSGRVEFEIRYRDGTPQATRSVRFVAGVPTPAVVTLASPEAYAIVATLRESTPGAALHDLQLLEPGAIAATFRPAYLADLTPGRVCRHLDITATNNSGVTDWTPREAATFARIVACANAGRYDVWVNVPHEATDAYLASAANVLHTGLAPGLRFWLEYSNEVWNGDFAQNKYAQKAGAGLITPLRARSLASDGTLVVATRPAHGLATGDVAIIAGATDARYNGEYPATRIDADRVSYTPKVPPPAGEAVAVHSGTCPLVCFRADLATAVTKAAWVQTGGPDQTYLEFATALPHGIAGEDLMLIVGAADPAVNGIYRADSHLQADPGPLDPLKLYAEYWLQYRTCPLPAAPGPLVAGPSGPIRAIKLAGSPTASHVVELGAASHAWQARRTRQLGDAGWAATKGTPGRFGLVLGLWSGSGGNAALMDAFLAECPGGVAPADYPVLAAHAPYLANEGDAVDRAIVGDWQGLNSLTATAGIVTASGPFLRPDGSSSPVHGLTVGQRVNVVNASPPAYGGPTTIATATATEFTYTLPVGAGDLPAAMPHSNRVGMGVVPLPAPGREVTAVARSGEVFTLTSPRHGLAPGDVVDLAGVNAAGGDYPPYDGRFAIRATPTPDTLTVVVPGATFDPTSPTRPDDGYRPWLIPASATATIVDAVAAFAAGPYDSRMVRPAAEQALARGLVPAFYEMGVGDAPGRDYRVIEPANFAHQAASRDPRMRGIVAGSLATAYKRGVALACWYGHAGSWSYYGSWPPKEWLEDAAAPKWLGLADARASFGHPPGIATFDLSPTRAETSTPITLTATGPADWYARLVAAPGDGVTLAPPCSAMLRFTPPSAPGIVPVTLGGIARPIVVDPAPPRRLWLDTPSLRMGEARKNVPITGFNTRWAEKPSWSLPGGSIKDVVIADAAHATATITAPDAFGPATLADGLGASASIPVVVEQVVDDADPGCVVTPGWLATAGGLGGNRRYRRGTDAGQSITWTMTATIDGAWSYAVDFPDGGAVDATYSILKDGAVVATVVIDQSRPSIGTVAAGNLLFQPVGSIALARGDTLAVRLEGVAASGGYLLADACRFATEGADAPSPDLLVDDVAGPGFAATGPWNPAGQGLGGSGRYAGGSAEPAATATWQAIAPAAGIYEVFASWPPGADNAPEAPYQFLLDGVTVGAATVDQRAASAGDVVVSPGIGLQYLGTIAAPAPGRKLGLRLTARGGTFVAADAARFRLVPGPPAVVVVPDSPPPPPPPTETDLIRGRLDAIEARQARTDAILDLIRSALSPPASARPDGGAPRP